MYSRSYYDRDGEKYTLGVEYGGTALSDQPPRQSAPPEPQERRYDDTLAKKETKVSPSDCDEAISQSEDLSQDCMGNEGSFGGILSYIKGIFRGKGSLLSRSGWFNAEDLLILGIALYLLFSKSGDTECAIMIALLFLIR